MIATPIGCIAFKLCKDVKLVMYFQPFRLWFSFRLFEIFIYYSLKDPDGVLLLFVGTPSRARIGSVCQRLIP